MLHQAKFIKYNRVWFLSREPRIAFGTGVNELNITALFSFQTSYQLSSREQGEERRLLPFPQSIPSRLEAV